MSLENTEALEIETQQQRYHEMAWSEGAMSQTMKAEIVEINSRIEEAEDPRECYQLVREKIRTHELRGEAIPDDLRRLERVLLTECNAESQGR